MAINKKFISFATQAQFDAKVAELDDRSIVFIEDTKRIWTHGVFFDTPWNYVTGKPNTLSGYGITDAALKVNSLYYVEGNTSGTAGSWTGTIPEITSLYTGLTIAYKIGVAGAATTNLDINGYGNKIVRRNNTNLTTHLPANTVVILTYDGTYWVSADYTDGYLSDSPQDGKIYGRKDGGWTEVDSDMYDWTWLYDIPQSGTCTQQQYDDLLAAVQTGNLFPHPVNSFVFPIEEIEGDAIILNMIRILGNDAMFAFWGILPDLTVESNFFSLEGVVQQIVSQQSIKLGETSTTAYRGDRGKIAYDHSQTAHDYVPTNSFKGSTFTTSVIPLNNPLGSFRVATASNVATYTLSTTKVIGAWAKILVNRATAPTVTGGTLIKGSDFIASTNMYLYVSYDGTKSEYYFAEI